MVVGLYLLVPRPFPESLTSATLASLGPQKSKAQDISATSQPPQAESAGLVVVWPRAIPFWTPLESPLESPLDRGAELKLERNGSSESFTG